MNLFSRDTIQADVLINRFAMFLIVAKSIEHLGQCQVRQPSDDFFRGDAEFPQLGDRTHWGTRTCHDGSSVENVFGADDIGMARGGGYDRDFRRGAWSVYKPTGGMRRSPFSFTDMTGQFSIHVIGSVRTASPPSQRKASPPLGSDQKLEVLKTSNLNYAGCSKGRPSHPPNPGAPRRALSQARP